MADPDETTNKLRGRCGECSHVWVLAYLPMSLEKVAKIGKRSICPKCAGTDIFMPTDVFEIDASIPVVYPKCQGAMRIGKAMGQTFTGIGDFHDNNTVCTMSAGGPGALINYYKCEACGWSIS